MDIASHYAAGTREFYGMDLKRAYAAHMDLRGSGFASANLCSANLVGSDLRGCDLSCAKLTKCNLRDADLRGCDLTGASITNAKFSRTDLRGCDLTRTAGFAPTLRFARLEGATIPRRLRYCVGPAEGVIWA